MKRPNRYPYTRSQWVEEITIAHMSDDTTFKFRVERNEITGETRE
nr:MAG TPA: hypothetical protein [Caudoviricetes sp.]